MIGLAPEIPEDLYMLIKKVMLAFLFSLAFPMAHPMDGICSSHLLGCRCAQAPRA
jgi:hypothetical protein